MSINRWPIEKENSRVSMGRDNSNVAQANLVNSRQVNGASRKHFETQTSIDRRHLSKSFPVMKQSDSRTHGQSFSSPLIRNRLKFDSTNSHGRSFVDCINSSSQKDVTTRITIEDGSFPKSVKSGFSSADIENGSLMDRNGKGASERTEKLFESQLSISTLSLTSSNTVDSISGDVDDVSEEFWKILAGDHLGGTNVNSANRWTTINEIDDDVKEKENGPLEIAKLNRINHVGTIVNGYAKNLRAKNLKRIHSSKITAENLRGQLETNEVRSDDEKSSDNSINLTKVTDLTSSLLADSSASDYRAGHDNIAPIAVKSPFLPGSRHQSTPKYSKLRDVRNGGEKGCIVEKELSVNEKLAEEFYGRILKQRESKSKAKAWVKWTTRMKRKSKERMKAVFFHWKEIHLQLKRDFLVLGSAKRRKMKETYYEWKLSFDVEQRNDIASFHFKLSILTRCIQLWKVYIAERRVKAKMARVARLHFDFHSTRRIFQHWRNSTGKSSTVTRNINKRLLLRVFNGWRKWTQYSRMLHKRHLSSCKEYHNRTLMRNALKAWKHQLCIKMAFNCRIISMRRRAFTLWKLKSQRLLLRRRISTAHCSMVLQRKCFTMWIEHWKVRAERRRLFIVKINRLHLKRAFFKWGSLTQSFLCIKKSRLKLEAAQEHQALKNALGQWKRKMDVIRFKEKVADDRIKRIVKNAALKWRGGIIDKKLQYKLIAAMPFFEFLRLKGIFRQWKREKLKSDRERQRANVIASFVNRGCLSRVFTEWRIVTQEDRIIYHMVSRKQRYDTARSFDAWRLIVTRKRVSQEYRRIKELEATQKIFRHWRAKLDRIARERETRISYEKKTLNGITAAWREVVREKKDRRYQLSSKYFCLWKNGCTFRIESRERREAAVAHRHILLKTRFRFWTRRWDEFKRKRVECEKEAAAFRDNVLKVQSLRGWRRQFHVHCIVSEYNEDKRICCLDNAFSQWKDFVQQQLQDAVGKFADRLERESPRSLRNHTLSDSYSSGDIPLLRSSSGYFGSLPNIAKISSPLPKSPLATGRSAIGRNSPASLSPEYHQYDRSPRSGLLERSCTFSSPVNYERSSSLDRSRSLLNEGTKSSHSIQSSGSLSNRPKSPVTVPPLFTSGYQDDDEDYTELTRPSSLPLQLTQRNLLLQREQSVEYESPGSVFGHNFDEDAMSFYSFRSGSAGMNREHLISGMIRHWRHLPLSKTFRAWFKYTQDKKLRIELFNHFLSSKSIWTARRVFVAWHRKLYCRLASEKFARTRLLKKHFKAIYGNLILARTKEERDLIAQLHFKNSKLASVFKSWRRKVSAKRKLHSLVGRWQEAVHMSEGDKVKSEQMLKRTELKTLRNTFDHWKSLKLKYVAASELCDILRMRRTLKVWQENVVRENSQRHGFEKIVKLRTKFVFLKWKASFHSEKKAAEHLKNLKMSRFKNAFYSWLEWTKERKTKLSTVLKLQRRMSRKLVAQAFFVWSEEAARLKLADDHFKEKLCLKIIDSWHEHTDRRLDLTFRLEDYRVSSTRTRMRNVFDWWKRSAICSGVFKERQKLSREALLAAYFSRWRKDTRQRKSEKHFKKTILKRTFSKWSIKYFQLHRQRRLATSAAKKWLIKAQVNRSLDEHCNMLVQKKKKITRRKVFSDWREATSRVGAARAHYESSLLSKTLVFWHEKSTRKHKLKIIRASTERIVELNLVSSSFYTWIDLFHRRRRNEVVLENYLELKQQEMMKLCLVNFRINALKSRSEQFSRLRLQRKVWKQWRDKVHQRNSLAKIRMHHARNLALKYAKRWKKKTKDVIALGIIADQAILKRDSSDLKSRFQCWFLKMRARSLAKMCFQSHLLKSAFINWKSSAKLNLSRKRLLLQFKQRREQKELKRRFKKWTDRADKSQKEKKLEEVHEQIAKAHFRRMLVEKCFFGWRYECIVQKMRQKRALKICAEYFGIWKNDCLGANRAEQMYHQNLIEKAWKRWRRIKIKTDVLRAMEVHENRKQLSEVFSAWYDHTYIQRHAIKDFQLTKLRRLFRKWMQQYNKS